MPGVRHDDLLASLSTIPEPLPCILAGGENLPLSHPPVDLRARALSPHESQQREHTLAVTALRREEASGPSFDSDSSNPLPSLRSRMAPRADQLCG